jgi:uncharacterized protein YkwD
MDTVIVSRRTLVVLACAAVAAVAASTGRAADDPAALLAPAGTCGAADDELNLSQAAAAQAMLCLTNFARARAGLAALRASTALDQAGAAKLAANISCNEFSHTPCGEPFSDVFAAYLAGANGYRIGENIAWGTGSYGTPRQTMLAWLNSAGHRENILNAEFQELGIGYLAGQTFLGYSGAALWSQEFGTRAPAATSPPAAAPQPSAATSTPQRQKTTRPPHRMFHRSRRR